MSNLMNRSFSRREKYLMLLLVLILLIGIYFYVVHYPITERMAEIDEETEEVLFQTDVANARLQIYNDMKTELDEIFAMPEDEITVMPEYPNNQTLLNMFNVIFAGTDQKLSFDAERIDGNICERTMRFSFTATSYNHARQVLTSLTRTGYRCLLDSLSFAPDNDGSVENGTLNVSGSITFYELVKE